MSRIDLPPQVLQALVGALVLLLSASVVAFAPARAWPQRAYRLHSPIPCFEKGFRCYKPRGTGSAGGSIRFHAAVLETALKNFRQPP